MMIDCTPLSVGGGIQVALALLDGLARQAPDDPEQLRWSAVVSPGLYRLLSPQVAARKEALFVVEKTSALDKARAAIALRRIERKLRPDLVFTVFGPSYFIARAPHLVGFALPHMIYDPDPEIDPEGFGRHSLSDVFAAIFRRATHLVVETQTVRDRLAARLGVGAERISVIGNAVNPRLAEFSPSPPPSAAPFRFLIPSAYYPHKNLEIVPQVAAAMRRLAPDLDARFVLTLPGAEAPWRKIAEGAQALGVADAVVTLGTLTLAALARAYGESHAVFLPTIREASTAVYPESFYFRRPVVTSDLDFARELCGEAALYAPTRDAEATARALIALARDAGLRERLVEAGLERGPRVYPSPDEKLRQQFDLMRRVAARA